MVSYHQNDHFWTFSIISICIHCLLTRYRKKSKVNHIHSTSWWVVYINNKIKTQQSKEKWQDFEKTIRPMCLGRSIGDSVILNISNFFPWKLSVNLHPLSISSHILVELTSVLNMYPCCWEYSAFEPPFFYWKIVWIKTFSLTSKNAHKLCTLNILS